MVIKIADIVSPLAPDAVNLNRPQVFDDLTVGIANTLPTV